MMKVDENEGATGVNVSLGGKFIPTQNLMLVFSLVVCGDRVDWARL